MMRRRSMKEGADARSLSGVWPWFVLAALFAGAAVVFGADRLAGYLPSEAAAYRDQFLQGISLVRIGLACSSVLALFSVWAWRPAAWRQPEGGMRARVTKADILVVLGLAGVAAGLRSVMLSSSFTWDELATLLRIVRRSWPVTLAFSANGNNHVINSALVKVSLDVLGEGEIAARLPAAAMGVAVPVAVYTLLKPRAGVVVALCAGAASVFHFPLLVHSTLARGYSGAVFCSLLCCLFFAMLCW